MNQSGFDPSTHILESTGDQFQIHFVDSTTSTVPSWLKCQMDVVSTSNSHKIIDATTNKITNHKDYDPEHGNYNLITQYLWKNNNMVFFNGTSIPTGK